MLTLIDLWMRAHPLWVLALGSLPALVWLGLVWPHVVGRVRVQRVLAWHRSMRRYSGYTGEEGVRHEIGGSQ